MTEAMPCVAAYVPAASAASVVESNSPKSPVCAMRKPALSMMSAAEASLRETSSPSTRSNSRTSSAISWGKAINRVWLSELLHTVAFIDELMEQHACDHVQLFKY